MLLKLLIALLLLFVIVNLGLAMRGMLNPSKLPMSHYIGRRLWFSAAIIALILLALATGLIQPNPRPY
ncbi:DUF2909 family protein [Alginatibacterium sediminis]|uniref:DUF2909 family protein n=1 Tax=Alginatibacterium sediminis TaxID=2164068 RepID=A0A420E642_9ALTE|nr:DUF2909 family protein [Alginatibacterium sediminis]RKF13332.1 DUF2909 family protein [Alginatibacterium sediminis]